MKNDVTVLLLAGGKSNRFWPIADKMELSFLGLTLLERQIEFFKSVGLNNIILVTNENLSTKYQKLVKKVIIQKSLGMGAAVLSARKEIENKQVLIVIADDIVDESVFKGIFEKIKAKTNFIIGYYTPNYFPGGYLKLNGNKIEQIIEKPEKGKEPSKFVAIFGSFFTDGSQIINSLEKLKHNHFDKIYEDAISDLIFQGHKFEMVPYKDSWIALKYPWDTFKILNYFLQQIIENKIHKSAQIHKSVSIVGPVEIEENVKVMENAKLVGPLHIGKNTIIGNNTLIRSSNIGENCVIGFGSDICRSYLGDNVWLHSNYIGDSIVSSNVSMGAGTTLANLRFDEAKIYSVVKNQKINTQKQKLGAIIGENSR